MLLGCQFCISGCIISKYLLLKIKRSNYQDYSVRYPLAIIILVIYLHWIVSHHGFKFCCKAILDYRWRCAQSTLQASHIPWLRTAHSSVNFCRFPQGQALHQTFQKLLDFRSLNSSRVLQITALTTLKIFSNLLEYTHSFPTVLTTNNSLRAIWWLTRKGSFHGENSQKNEWLFHEKKSKGNSDNSKKIIILTCE